MAEYITKEQVRDIMAAHYPYATLREETAMHHINEDLKALPAADVVEVVHGEWFAENNRPKSSMFYCSFCHRTCNDIQPIRKKGWKKRCRYAYCPNCGAKMDITEG